MLHAKKVGRGRPRSDTEQVAVRLPRDLLDGIDAYAAEEADKPGRPEALRRIVRDWLVGHGLLPPQGDQ